jgi:hypothetical protein
MHFALSRVYRTQVIWHCQRSTIADRAEQLPGATQAHQSPEAGP